MQEEKAENASTESAGDGEEFRTCQVKRSVTVYFVKCFVTYLFNNICLGLPINILPIYIFLQRHTSQ